MTLFQRIRETGKDRKGFTLGELLIVVAIIGVLVAISIPIFTRQLYKSKIAVTQANLRSIYSEMVVDYLDDGKYEISFKYENNHRSSAESGKKNKRRKALYDYDIVLKHSDGREETFKIYYMFSSWAEGQAYEIVDGKPPWIDVPYYPEPTGNTLGYIKYGERY